MKPRATSPAPALAETQSAVALMARVREETDGIAIDGLPRTRPIG